MRAIWKGHIRFSLVTIPIAVYSAIETSKMISFNQLHKEDNGRVGYQKKCKKCGDILGKDDIVKGYEYEPDQYVLIDDEDFEKVKVKSTKVIEIEGFIDAEEVHPTLFEAPYYAGPDGPVAAKAYALLAQTLRDTGKMGIGRVALRDRENIVMITPHGPGLVMYKLRFPDEVRAVDKVPQLDGLEADKDQLKLARTLVDSMATSLADIEMVDHYKAAINEMVVAKVEGKEVVTVEEEDRPVVDIMTALKESIEKAKDSKKPMKKAAAKKSSGARKSTASRKKSA